MVGNQAGASYSFAGEAQPSETSNRVDTVIPSVRSLVVSPKGNIVDELMFTLSNVPAGYTVRLEYPIEIRGGLKGALIAPTIEWSVR